MRMLIYFVTPLIALISLSSCKKVAQEAGEVIEKKAGKMLEGAEKNEYQGIKNAKRARKLKKLMSGNPEEVTYVMCGRCQGQGFLYVVDNYGNIMRDYNGNPQTVQCPNCSGSGQVEN